MAFSTYRILEITIGPPDRSGYPLFVRGPGGDAHGILALPTDEVFQSRIARLTRLDVDEAELEALGQSLFQAIFYGRIKDVYVRSQGVVAYD
jgi:hypothetical protein